MRALLFLFLSLMVCPFMLLVAPAAAPTSIPTTPPTITPPAANVSAASIDIRAAPETIHAGDTVTITGVPLNIGLPYYTLTLTSGFSVTVTYDDDVRSSQGDALFEVVAAHGEMNRVTFTLRALVPGSADAVISATGEMRTAEGAFSWGGGSSPNLTLIVTNS